MASNPFGLQSHLERLAREQDARFRLRAETLSEFEALQGALAVAPGVWMYQLTDKGLALEATVKGTKYWKDSDLNKN